MIIKHLNEENKSLEVKKHDIERKKSKCPTLDA